MIEILFLVAATVFLCVEMRIFTFAMKEPAKGADCVIVLGSQIKEDGPSIDFKARLDSAYEYLMNNPESKVICTGGQGVYEPCSEAKGGRDYLLSLGVSKEKILIEDQSTNTVENLKNARQMINEEDKVVIVSADYHLYRASYIARKIGYTEVSCKGGHGLWILLPQYYTREFFALFKEYLTLNSF